MSKSKPIYLDYASTTPVDERVAEKMLEYMTFNNNFGSAASRSHSSVSYTHLTLPTKA